MGVFRYVLRGYSYVFETVLCLIAIALSAVTLLSRNEDLKLGWLPWEGRNLLIWLLVIGIGGLVCIVASAATGRRIFLVVLSLAIFIILAKGFFFGVYTVSGPDEAKSAAWLIGGALLAVIGAIPGGSPAERRRSRR